MLRTWLASFVIGFSTICLGAGLYAAPRVMCCFGCESKRDVALVTVKQYAFEAFPQWSLQHPDDACPRSLLDLNEWMNHEDDRDPWGGHYVMVCTARGIVVMSAGEDGRLGTDDDVRSWE